VDELVEKNTVGSLLQCYLPVRT